jgi:hypothetical protein
MGWYTITKAQKTHPEKGKKDSRPSITQEQALNKRQPVEKPLPVEKRLQEQSTSKLLPTKSQDKPSEISSKAPQEAETIPLPPAKSL